MENQAQKERLIADESETLVPSQESISLEVDAPAEGIIKGFQSRAIATVEDVSREDFSEEECQKRYGVSKETLLGELSLILRAREKNLYITQFLRVNPSISAFDEGVGLYRLKTSESEALFGAAFSIVDATASLEAMRSIAHSLESGVDLNGEIPGHARFKSKVVISGSSAQSEVQLFPADYDFAEHLDIDMFRNEDFAPHLAELILDPVRRSASISDLDFREMKYGIYPNAYGKGPGQPIWWSPEEIAKGEKLVQLDGGGLDRLSIHHVEPKPGMIKLNWIRLFEGELKELTKVVNVRVRSPDGRELYSNRIHGSAFQEIYFEDVRSFHLTELVSDPMVLGEYLRFLRREVAHYAESERPNYLKAAKRAYAFIKIYGSIDDARKLAELFKSPISELAARAESLALLSGYIKQGGKFEFPRLATQAEKVGAFFARNRDLFTDRELTLLMEATGVIKDKLLDGVESPRTLALLVDHLEWRSRQIVNKKSLEYINENETMRRLINPARS